MISVKSVIHKGRRGLNLAYGVMCSVRSIVLIPGWATDYRIFNFLNLKVNYLMPVASSPATFESNLLEVLKQNNLTKVSILGWSLGGFVAAEFASGYPDLIDELILVSIRKRYREEELNQIRGYLRKDKKAYLYKFYNECFYDKKDFAWFKENLLKDYCDNFKLDYLFEGLDYLEKAEIRPELLNNIKRIKIVHGGEDKIAPIQEAEDIALSLLPDAQWICIEKEGHIPFFSHNVVARFIEPYIWSIKE